MEAAEAVGHRHNTAHIIEYVDILNLEYSSFVWQQKSCDKTKSKVRKELQEMWRILTFPRVAGFCSGEIRGLFSNRNILPYVQLCITSSGDKVSFFFHSHSNNHLLECPVRRPCSLCTRSESNAKARLTKSLSEQARGLKTSVSLEVFPPSSPFRWLFTSLSPPSDPFVGAKGCTSLEPG